MARVKYRFDYFSHHYFNYFVILLAQYPFFPMTNDRSILLKSLLEMLKEAIAFIIRR
jgi:hypothetical protein